MEVLKLIPDQKVTSLEMYYDCDRTWLEASVKAGNYHRIKAANGVMYEFQVANRNFALAVDITSMVVWSGNRVYWSGRVANQHLSVRTVAREFYLNPRTQRIEFTHYREQDNSLLTLEVHDIRVNYSAMSHYHNLHRTAH